MNHTTPDLKWFQRTHTELIGALDSVKAARGQKPVTLALYPFPFFFWLIAAVLVAPHLSWPTAGFLALLCMVLGFVFWLVSLMHG